MMQQAKVKPGKWPYWLAGLAVILGVGGGVVMIIMSVFAMLAFKPHRMLAPGSSTAILDEDGSHSIYHEYITHFDGKDYRTRLSQRGDVWDRLRVVLTDARTGERIPARSKVTGASYKYGDRAGKAIYGFSVPGPTEVKVRAYYEDNWRGPKVVLAVGKMKIAQFVVLLTVGIFAVIGGFTIAIPVIVVTAVLRASSRSKLRAQGLHV